MTGLKTMPMTPNWMDTESDTLTQARSLIGNLHQSGTSGRTLDCNIAQVDYKNILFFTTLAVSSLVNSLLEAAYILGHRRKKNAEGKTNPRLQKASRQAFAFISGTGLDLMIERCQLDYDPDEIRSQFYILFNVPD